MAKKIYQLIRRFAKEDLFALEEYKNQLIGLGLGEDSFTEYYDTSDVYLTLYESSLSAIRNLQKRISGLGIDRENLIIQELKEDQWVNVWKEGFKAFQLTPRIKVVPVWEKEQSKEAAENVVFIDTKFAFGTGLHETTRFTANLVEKYSGRFKTFLDLGTGTGILAMVALKNGAEIVEGIDIDPDAIQVAKENLSHNGCEACRLEAKDIQDVAARRKYDFVAANLVTHDLIRLKKKIFKFVKKNGFLAISGISLENRNLVKKSFAELPLKCLKIEKGTKWIAILYKRID